MTAQKPKTPPLTAARIAVVVLAGPVALAAATAAGAVDTARALRAGRRPRIGSALMLGAAATYVAAVPRIRGWGATAAEREGPMTGDETVTDPGVQHTRAVAIDAPAERVWPWLVQIGQDRAGFYSYTWLENLVGCRMRNADRIHPEWQQRAVGDTLLLHPQAGYEIVALEPGRALALEAAWYFAVEPDGPQASRLIARWRCPQGPLNTIFALLFELPHFVMERKMLLGIKRRAEAARS
ncbi:MAG: hypothetical protein QOJ46_2751 [bacterium]